MVNHQWTKQTESFEDMAKRLSKEEFPRKELLKKMGRSEE